MRMSFSIVAGTGCICLAAIIGCSSPMRTIQLSRQIAVPDSIVCDNNAALPVAAQVHFSFVNHTTVVRVVPVTYESIRALCNLPVSIILCIRRYPAGEAAHIKNRADIDYSNRTICQSNCTGYPALSLSETETGYSLLLKNGMRLAGIAGDTILGQMLLDKDAGYCQVLDLWLLSSLPPEELRAALDEWYSRLPAGIQKPVISSLKPE